MQTVIELAVRLGYRVVAEGIEDATTLELLKAWGSHEAQGYHIARPMRPDMLMEWIATHSL
mgnify:CR=1 FL=1